MRRGMIFPLFLAAVALPLTTALLALVATELLADAPPERNSGYRWTKLTQRPVLQRTEVAGAVAGGDIYVIGGFVAPNRTVAAVERLRRGRWGRVRPLPQALNHAGAVGYRGAVYVVGGYASRDGLGAPVPHLQRYDPRRNRWTRLPDMPTARAALAVGAADGKIFAAGGSNGARALDTLEIYDIAKRRWSKGPPISVPREHLGGAARGSQFFAVAGRNERGNLDIVERYDARSGRWTKLADVPTARGGNGAALMGAGLVAVGGEEAATIGEVERYDFSRRRWEVIAPMPTPRHGLAVVTLRGRVLAVAGGPQPGFAFSNAVERLSRR